MWDRLECSGEEVWLDFSGPGFLLDTDPYPCHLLFQFNSLHIGLELDSSRQMDFCFLSFGYGYYCFQQRFFLVHHPVESLPQRTIDT